MRYKMRITLVTFCFLFLSSESLMAQETEAPTSSPNTTAQTKTSASDLKPSSEKKLSLDLDISSDSNFRSPSDPGYAADSYFALMPGYKVSKTLTLTARLGVDQKLYADQRTDLADTTIKATFSPIQLGPSQDLKFGLAGVLPTSDVDRLQNSFEGGVGASVEFTQRYTTFGLNQKGETQFVLSGLKNFHQYELTYEFVPNVSYRAREMIILSQDLSKTFSLGVIAFYQTGWTYQNDLKTFFHIDETLNYALNKQISFYVGHSNEANALQNNGIDSNIGLYDGYTSIFKAGTTISF